MTLQDREAGINWPSNLQDTFWEQPARIELLLIGDQTSHCRWHTSALLPATSAPCPADVTHIVRSDASSAKDILLLYSAGGGSTSAAAERDAKALQVVHMSAEMEHIAKVGLI